LYQLPFYSWHIGCASSIQYVTSRLIPLQCIVDDDIKDIVRYGTLSPFWLVDDLELKYENDETNIPIDPVR
jgi:cAMP phosphodiesterase